jgi:hypothetical protein
MAKLFLRPKVDGSWRVAIIDHSKNLFQRPYGVVDFARTKPMGSTQPTNDNTLDVSITSALLTQSTGYHGESR